MKSEKLNKSAITVNPQLIKKPLQVSMEANQAYRRKIQISKIMGLTLKLLEPNQAIHLGSRNLIVHLLQVTKQVNHSTNKRINKINLRKTQR